MVPLLGLVVLLAIVFWLGKEVGYARRRRAFLATRDGRGQPLLPPHQRVSDAELQRRARELRAAMLRGDITFDEAAGSLIRLAGGGMTVDGARRLLNG